MGPGLDARPRARARHVPGRVRPLYPRDAPPVRYPRDADFPFMAPQAMRSGVVTAWLQPKFLDLDFEAEVGLPTTPPLPAVPGPSSTPPPGDAILQMALADPVEHGNDATLPAATPSPPPTVSEAAAAISEDTTPPVGLSSPRPPDLGCAGVAPSPPVSPIALAGHINLRVYLRNVDPPRPATPPLFPEGVTWFSAATPALCDDEYVQDDCPLIPAWLFDTETGSRTPVSPTGDSCPAIVPAPADSPPRQDSPWADDSTGPVIFGRWAAVVPIGGVPFCHFSNIDGPPDRLVLPPAELVHERYQQALAFVRQRGGRGVARRLDLPVSDHPCTQS